MKHITSLLVLGLFSLSSFAQKGFYLAPSIGAGISNGGMRMTYSAVDMQTLRDQYNFKNVFSYKVGMSIGYQCHHWRFQTGLQYLTRGFKLDDQPFLPLNIDPSNNILSDLSINYKHIVIPLQIGYQLNLSRKLSLVPYLGLMVGYNTGGIISLNTEGKIARERMTKEIFDNVNHRLSLWTTVVFHVAYKVNNKISLFGGPSYQQIISNLEDFPNDFSLISRNYKRYAANLDLGLKITL